MVILISTDKYEDTAQHAISAMAKLYYQTWDAEEFMEKLVTSYTACTVVR